MDRTKGPVQQALKDAGVSANEVDEVVLVWRPDPNAGHPTARARPFRRGAAHGVNPHEVVAIQARVLKGEVKDVLLLDVTPLSLGVETQGGVMTALIQRNTTNTTSKAETFSTAADGQTSADVHILQGERPLASENKSLGRSNLDGIRPGPRGTTQIEVSADIDANGILNVLARDKATAKEQRVVIQSSSGLSEAEIQKMVRDADTHASEGARRRPEIEDRNQAGSAHYQDEKSLREQGFNLSAGVRDVVTSGAAVLKQAIDGNDPNRMRSTIEKLQQALIVGRAAYGGSAGQDGAGGQAQGTPPGPEGAVGGEYREV